MFIIEALSRRVSLLEMSPLRRLEAAVVEAKEPGGGGGGLEFVRVRVFLSVVCLLTSQVRTLGYTI